jgi:hypothetical protein
MGKGAVRVTLIVCMKYIVDTREGNTAERVPGDVVPGVIVAGEGDAGAGRRGARCHRGR